MGTDGRPFVLDGIGDSPPTPSSSFKEDEGPPSSPRIGIVLTRWPVCRVVSRGCASPALLDRPSPHSRMRSCFQGLHVFGPCQKKHTERKANPNNKTKLVWKNKKSYRKLEKTFVNARRVHPSALAFSLASHRLSNIKVFYLALALSIHTKRTSTRSDWEPPNHCFFFLTVSGQVYFRSLWRT
jgi:hypothetical protein